MSDRRVHRSARALVPPVLLALALAAPRPAGAQPQTKEQQACIDVMNKSLAKVASALGKEICGCIKAGAQGKLAGTIESCTTADPKDKVAKAEAKTADQFGKKCGGASLPDFGVTDPATVNGAAREKELTLFHDVFGPDLDLAIVSEASDKDAALCQQKIAKDLKKCQDTKLKEFNKCKKEGLKRAVDPIDDAADLETCIGADPKGSIAKKCDLLAEPKPGKFTLDAIRKSLDTQCLAKGVDLAAAFPGCAAADRETTHACLDAFVECRVCRALNAADGLARNCDLFDDGAANGSCGDVLFIGQQQCILDGSSFIVDLNGGTFFLNELNGDLTIDCGAVDPGTMSAACTCAIGAVEPVPVFGVGFACLSPAPGCPTGTIDCDGGSGLDLAMTTTHNLGACTSNADCAAQCAGECASIGAAVFDSGCEGFCRGGTNDGMPCLADVLCPGGGTCNGLDGNIHGSICGCHCLAQGGNPSLAGALRCDVGVQINVEQALPCNGADVLIPVGRHCIPFTTELTSGVIVDGANTPDNPIPDFDNTAPGLPLACPDLAADGASGMGLVSTINFLDAPVIGDMSFQFFLACD